MDGSVESRLARAHPAEPPPTMMKSYRSRAMPRPSRLPSAGRGGGCCREDPHRYRPRQRASRELFGLGAGDGGAADVGGHPQQQRAQRGALLGVERCEEVLLGGPQRPLQRAEPGPAVLGERDPPGPPVGGVGRAGDEARPAPARRGGRSSPCGRRRAACRARAGCPRPRWPPRRAPGSRGVRRGGHRRRPAPRADAPG